VQYQPSPARTEISLLRAKQISFTLNIAAEEAKQIAEKDRAIRQNGMPFSVALLGLIPVSVGLAYLVFYYAGNTQRMGDVRRNAGQ